MMRASRPVPARFRARAARQSAVLLLAAALLAAGLAAAAALPLRPAASARADEGTISANNLRNGWDPGETTGSLTPSALTGGSFGQLAGTCPLSSAARPRCRCRTGRPTRSRPACR